METCKNLREIKYRHFKKFTEKHITFNRFKFENVIFAKGLKLNITFKNCNLKNMAFNNIHSGEMSLCEDSGGLKYSGGLKFINCKIDNVYLNGWGSIEKKNCIEFMFDVGSDIEINPEVNND